MSDTYDMNDNKRVGAIILACSAAALAGIAAVSAVALWRASRRPHPATDGDAMRNIEDVLTDCYTKISEIEHSMPEDAPGPIFVEPGTNGHVART